MFIIIIIIVDIEIIIDIIMSIIVIDIRPPTGFLQRSGAEPSTEAYRLVRTQDYRPYTPSHDLRCRGQPARG